MLRYTELGKTGMKISHLSFGASSLGSVFRETNEKESFEAVEAAIEGGINFIDVSPYYGHYKAETVLGKALRNIPRDGVNTWDYSAKRVTDSVYESMERLGIDYIDLINVHDIEFQAALPGGLQKVVDETLPALVELRDKGVVGHVGITDLQLENLKWVIEHSEKGIVESVLNFCHYTLNDDALTDYLDFFEANGIGVVNASPLSMGLLSQRGVPAWHPAPKPVVELAVQYSVSNPRIASTLFSSANPDNVRRNIAWASEEPDWTLVAEVKEIIGNQQRVTWANS